MCLATWVWEFLHTVDTAIVNPDRGIEHFQFSRKSPLAPPKSKHPTPQQEALVLTSVTINEFAYP